MGFDVSYHLIKEEEFNSCYFDLLELMKQGKKSELISIIKTKISDQDYVEEYLNILEHGVSVLDLPFEKTHGFYIANIHGMIRKYYYLRGSAFSFLLEDNNEFSKYVTSLSEYSNTGLTYLDKITENYMSGAFINREQVKTLRVDYQNNSKIRAKLDSFYDEGHINVFLKILDKAIEEKCGILEASDVVEINIQDLNSSYTNSNLLNCDTEGVMLYYNKFLEQIKNLK